MLTWSTLDEKRFGLRTAKLTIDSSSIDLLREIRNFKNEGGKLFIARCDATLTNTLFQMQSLGFFLTDSMLTFSTNPKLIKQEKHENPFTEVLPASKHDSELLAEMAGKAFSGYSGHYHNNPKLENKICDEIYMDWAKNLVQNENMADAVFLCRIEGKYAGFASLKVNEKEEAIAGLLGVLPEFQKKGVARLLHYSRFRWCIENGIKEIQVETSLNNKSYLNLLIGLGFKYHSAVQVIHMNNY